MLKFIEKLVYSPWAPSISRSITVVDVFQTRINKITGRAQSRRADVSGGRVTSSHLIVK